MATSANRLLSLDVLRGGTIAAMILVNFPGDGDHVFAPLRHSDWNGLTFTDLIAPTFLFVVGVSVVLAYGRQRDAGIPDAVLRRRTLVRALKIFAVGMALNVLAIAPEFDLADLRWTGTLHRIALVFLGCGLLFLHTTPRQQRVLSAGILVGYWLALTQVPTPGFAEAHLEPGVNLVAWVDARLLPGRMWQGTWDPESILSTFPALVSGLLGMQAGYLLRRPLPLAEQTSRLMTAGLLAGALGWAWSLAFPLNENLWTSSFVLLTGGFAALLLGAIYFLVDGLGRRGYLLVGIVFGTNAIAAYVLADLLAVVFYGISFGGTSLNAHSQTALTGLGFEPRLASLVYALGFVLVNFAVVYALLYQRRVFLKL